MTLNTNKIITLPFAILMAIEMFGQFSSQQSMGAFQPLSINPSFSTMHDALHVQMQHRSMWTGIAGAPKTTIFSASAAILPKKLYGTIQMESDKIGLFRTNKVMAGAATKLKIKTGHYFSFGLQIGLEMNIYRADQVVVNTQADQYITFENTKSSIFQMSTGMIYNAPTWYIAASVPRMMQRVYNGAGTWRANHDFKGYNFHVQGAKKWKVTQAFYQKKSST
jgi:type IX secretion system PorP/SprF family membrane protein